MPTQYEKLRETLLRHTQTGQQVSAREIRAWFALDWGPQQTIFPAHFATDPEGHPNPRQPLIQQAQEQPLLARCYGIDDQPLRSTYTVRVDGDAEDLMPQNAYDLLYQILEPYQGQTLSLQKLKQIVSKYLQAHGLERPGLLDNLHRYTPAGGYPFCLNGRHLLLPVERGHYSIQLPAPEKARADLVTSLQNLYQHEGLGLFDPLLFESLVRTHQPELWESHSLELNLLHKLSAVQLSLPEMLAAGILGSSKQEQALQELLRKHLLTRPDRMQLGVQQLRLILEDRQGFADKVIEQILERFLNPLHPELEHSWERLEIVYFSMQYEKAEIERYFHQDVPQNFRQIMPRELFKKALKWFLGGVKGKGSRQLTQAMQQRLGVLRGWECPGLVFWEQLSEPPVSSAPAAEWLVPWAEKSLHTLLQVPGLDEASDDRYPANYLVCGILAALFPEYVFAISPPSLEGLQHLSRRKLGNLYLGALPQDPQASNTVAWMAGILGQVYQLLQGLRQLRPKAAGLITPRRLDMMLYLLRDEHHRQHSFLNLLKEVSNHED